MKYLKVIFDDKSRYNYQYKIDEVNIANNFNKDAKNPKDMGGFNFSNEENILRVNKEKPWKFIKTKWISLIYQDNRVETTQKLVKS